MLNEPKKQPFLFAFLVMHMNIAIKRFYNLFLKDTWIFKAQKQPKTISKLNDNLWLTIGERIKKRIKTFGNKKIKEAHLQNHCTDYELCTSVTSSQNYRTHIKGRIWRSHSLTVTTIHKYL